MAMIIKTVNIMCITTFFAMAAFQYSFAQEAGKSAPSWPDVFLDSSTDSVTCGLCHVAIYREYLFAFGTDMRFPKISYLGKDGKTMTLPASISSPKTGHAFSGTNLFPLHARDVEKGSQSCNVCHFPRSFDVPDLYEQKTGKPSPRPKGQEAGGVSCVSCHLTKEGKIRGPYEVNAPHPTVVEPRIRTSAMCAYCHSVGTQVIGKQSQTFFEWREDFFKTELGSQHCQDCHMPRTLRKAAETDNSPIRTVARHLWTGGHSKQRIFSALSLVITQPVEGDNNIEFYIVNISAGHSVPTGSARRGIYLRAVLHGEQKSIIRENEWLFAPWYGDRPDDKAFMEEDKKREDAFLVMQADAQGPHEAPIRAGMDRTLLWTPNLPPGSYMVDATLVFDLNRFNDPDEKDDQTVMNTVTLQFTVK